MAPASYALTINVRFAPVGTLIVPDAVPLSMFRLKASVSGMSGAVTFTTTLVTPVDATLK